MLKLVIANKCHSSWSFRPWLLMTEFGIPFEEVLIPFGPVFDDPTWLKAISAYTPAGKVPALLDGDVQVWESLAIIDHIADTHADLPIWPKERPARAMARSISAEMHAGFSALRNACPMNFGKIHPPKDRGTQVSRDVDRICSIWRTARELHGATGPFLFGGFSAADAMFAPVVSRFVTYSIAVDPVSAAYMDSIQSTGGYTSWRMSAHAEHWIMPEDEADEPVLTDFRPQLSRSKVHP